MTCQGTLTTNISCHKNSRFQCIFHSISIDTSHFSSCLFLRTEFGYVLNTSCVHGQANSLLTCQNACKYTLLSALSGKRLISMPWPCPGSPGDAHCLSKLVASAAWMSILFFSSMSDRGKSFLCHQYISEVSRIHYQLEWPSMKGISLGRTLIPGICVPLYHRHSLLSEKKHLICQCLNPASARSIGGVSWPHMGFVKINISQYWDCAKDVSNLFLKETLTQKMMGMEG